MKKANYIQQLPPLLLPTGDPQRFGHGGAVLRKVPEKDTFLHTPFTEAAGEIHLLAGERWTPLVGQVGGSFKVERFMVYAAFFPL
ncbi:MAG: hypothetical protein P1S59_08445 [bacterium]|nr:hypothetical protein [bacterium]